jgi:sugar/nucleoside kinase (ribokinase family)
MGKILCIGQSVLDITIPMEDSIRENEKYQVLEEFRCGGGPAFNAAYLCAKWGADTSLLSQIGQDANGDYLKKVLEQGNVATDYLIINEKTQTSYSYIFTNKKNGARTLFNFPGNPNVPMFDFPDDEIKVILSDGHEPELSVEAIKRYPDAISIVDAGGYRPSTLTVAKASDYLVCSEYFAYEHTGKKIDLDNWTLCEDIFREIEQINGKYVVITIGEKGLLYKENGQLKHLPAFKVKALDTTGAGDIFHGAFAYGISENMPFLDILKMSSMASAISVETLGGNSSIPSRENVLERWKMNQ